MINFKKYKRFFAFGCSMTRYSWPTWADCIGREIPIYYNYGKSGGGNVFIASQIAEAKMRYHFNSDDLIIAMWSTITREDRYVNGTWETPGNIYSQNYYDQEFLKKYVDSRGQLIRDLSAITMIDGMMSNPEIDFYMLSMSPVTVDPSPYLLGEQRYDDVLTLFKPTIDKLLPDLLNTGCNGKWNSLPIRSVVPGGQTHDYHPPTKIHFEYINKVFPGTEWQQATIDFVEHHNNIVLSASILDYLSYQTPWAERL